VFVNTGQRIQPDGQLTLLSARPVDLVLSADGKTSYLKENEGLTIVDSASGAIRQRLPIKGGSSLTGLVLSAKGDRLYYSNSGSDIVEVDVAASPAKIMRTFTLPAAKVGGAAFPCGLAILGEKLYASLSRSNAVVELELASGKVGRTLAVEPAPFAVVVDSARRSLWVTSWGRTPQTGLMRSMASGTPVEVDQRGIAMGGALQQIDLETGKVRANIALGPQPCEILLANGDVLVALANADQVVRYRPTTGNLSTFWRSSLGAAPSGLTSWGSDRVAVACGGSNEISVLDARSGRVVETYRSAWYPLAVRAFQNRLFVVSAKGLGSRGNDLREGKFNDWAKTEKFAKPLGKDEAKSRGVYQFTGVLSVIPRSANLRKPDELPVVRAPRPNVAATPIPARPGEPSVFKHVVYVLKENRTYDQVFGDMPKGDGDPSLCIYGERVTPNQHAISDQFALLDNYYCNGVLSADGHSWSTEGNATTYFERTFGGWTRSYPYGDDPLAISSTGHIWDAVLDKGLSFKNYGEYDYADPTKGESYKTILQDFEAGERKVRFKHNIGIERLKRYSDPDCPGWNMGIPDVVRASYFIRDVKAGKLSAFNFVYLPQDHTSGGGAGSPSPEAHVADNDLAVGRIVDTVSHSKYWKDTVFFVVEDDPQAGFDHVDGHRSTCLVVSAYTKRNAVVSQFYNQGSVLKSISHILGLKPVTRTEIEANLMTDCFTRQPNLAVFDVRPNQVPLDQMNGAKSAFRHLDLSKPDRVDEQEFNRQLWALSGRSAPFPAALTGAHGRGLKAKGLRSVASRDTDD
jgi:DNA-binding beta-propeller fold protein YncE